MESSLLPHQHKGGSTGILAKKDMATRHDAILLYQIAIERLMLVNHWSKWCDKAGKFQLCDSLGTEITSPRVTEGLLIRVHLEENEGESMTRWLKVTEVFQEKDLLRDETLTGFSTLPVSSPLGEASEQKINPAEESIFYVMRRTNVVTAYMNELPEPGASLPQRFFKQALHLTIVFGNLLGFSKTQWRCLLQGFLEDRRV